MHCATMKIQIDIRIIDQPLSQIFGSQRLSDEDFFQQNL